MEAKRVTRGKRLKLDKVDYGVDSEASNEVNDGGDNDDDIRKSRIRDTNKEFAKRMTILQTWSDYWIDYTTREGEAYSKQEARNIIKKTKKIFCPIESCKKVFTTVGGLRYHYARCNIERCFKCKVCVPFAELKTRGDLLRHMIRIHYDKLPPLKDEQEEIAQSFLASAGRSERAKFRRSLGDSELISTQPKFYIKSFAELIANTLMQSSPDLRPFNEWHASIRDWDYIVSDFDRTRFCPPEQTSARFKTSKQSNCSSLSFGQSISLKQDKDIHGSMIFFTGGVNTAAAWVPKPPAKKYDDHIETLAIAVNCCSMDRSILYDDMKDISGCIQFWSASLCSNHPSSSGDKSEEPKLDFAIGHSFGVISAMNWCPLGVSWEHPSEHKPPNLLPRLGLLALACGDAQIRIISVPHAKNLLNKVLPSIKRLSESLGSTPMFRAKPIATLMPPGVGPSTDYQSIACTAISWNIDDNQRLIAAGYSNGDVALFDLANSSPLLYLSNDNRSTYQSYRRWQAHMLPVVGVSILSSDVERTLLASGGKDRLLRMWDSSDMESCLTYERAPITSLIWDYRLRGVVTASEAAFTSFLNRVSYRHPSVDGTTGATVSVHRTSVCGLNNSLITSSIATSDEAGEVFIQPTGRPNPKRTKNILDTFSLYTLIPLASFHTESLNKQISLGQSTESAGVGFNEIDEQTNENTDPNNEDTDENQLVDETYAERPVANKPAKFLLPIDGRAVDTYTDFRNNFILEFVEYDTKIPKGGYKLPEAWTRASNTSNIYCDRACDYPFSSIKQVLWSPNVESYSFLLSLTHVGFCRLDRVKVIETIFKGHIDTILLGNCEEKLQTPKI